MGDRTGSKSITTGVALLSCIWANDLHHRSDADVSKADVIFPPLYHGTEWSTEKEKRKRSVRENGILSQLIIWKPLRLLAKLTLPCELAPILFHTCTAHTLTSLAFAQQPHMTRDTTFPARAPVTACPKWDFEFLWQDFPSRILSHHTPFSPLSDEMPR